ncbi:MAG: hypothetical protein ACRDOD_15380, partial [Streptosporangiaceae bacterium]
MPAATVWTSAPLPSRYRRFLPEDVDVRRVPAAGDIDDAPQHADILIAGFDAARTIEILPQLRDLRVVQTLSA